MSVGSVAWRLPEDPTLASAAKALERRGFAGEVWDARWRLAYLTSEYRTLVSAGRREAEVGGLGEHILSPAMCGIRDAWPTGPTFESFRESLRDWGAFLIATSPDGRDGLLKVADPRSGAVLEELGCEPPPPAWTARVDVGFGSETIGNDVLMVCLHHADGRRAGYLAIVKPELRAGVLGMLALGDARLFERMSSLLEPARRPAALLFGDLERSSLLAKRLPTPAYFTLIRRLARAPIARLSAPAESSASTLAMVSPHSFSQTKSAPNRRQLERVWKRCSRSASQLGSRRSAPGWTRPT